MILLQCGKVWTKSPVTRYHRPALWRINNGQTIWIIYIAYLKKHPTAALNTSPHNHQHLQQPLSPHTCNSDQRRRGAPGLPEAEKKKAPDPEGVTQACLKSCADQLPPIFTKIFNRSLELCEVPSCFKCSTIIPIPMKPKITGLNDYRPVALTSVVMKSFEKLVLALLKDITGPLLDPLQFACRANRSVDDAVNMGQHYVLQHLDRPGAYVRILFVDFSSPFNLLSSQTSSCPN